MSNSIQTCRNLFVLAAMLFSSSGFAEDRSARPNILVVIAEDSSWLHYGAYGEKAARTAAFDRVASEGVLFTHAFCSEPTCSPSRAALSLLRHPLRKKYFSAILPFGYCVSNIIR